MAECKTGTLLSKLQIKKMLGEMLVKSEVPLPVVLYKHPFRDSLLLTRINVSPIFVMYSAKTMKRTVNERETNRMHLWYTSETGAADAYQNPVSQHTLVFGKL